MNTIDLGTRDYKDVWNIQKQLHARHVAGDITDTLLLVEHLPVLTIGRSGKKDNVLVDKDCLREKGIMFYEVERGGDVTYHGPGQLVGYPIMNIKRGFAGIRPYIEHLQKVVIRTLRDFDIEGTVREKMIGVWTEAGKICSIGVAVKRWVSFHGFALNVTTDLSYFTLINPCGMPRVEMTSMEKLLDRPVAIDKVKHHIIRNFGSVFDQKMNVICLEKIL